MYGIFGIWKRNLFFLFLWNIILSNEIISFYFIFCDNKQLTVLWSYMVERLESFQRERRTKTWNETKKKWWKHFQHANIIHATNYKIYEHNNHMPLCHTPPESSAFGWMALLLFFCVWWVIWFQVYYDIVWYFRAVIILIIRIWRPKLLWIWLRSSTKCRGYSCNKPCPVFFLRCFESIHISRVFYLAFPFGGWFIRNQKNSRKCITDVEWSNGWILVEYAVAFFRDFLFNNESHLGLEHIWVRFFVFGLWTATRQFSTFILWNY